MPFNYYLDLPDFLKAKKENGVAHNKICWATIAGHWP